MITTDRYRALTADRASGDVEVEEAIVDAQGLLEEYLGRPLEYGERTEQITPDRSGMLWPKATPIAEADGWTIDGLGLIGTAAVWFLGVDTVEVTYTGGWSAPAEEDPDGPVLPTCLQRDIALAAYRLLHPTIATIAGITPGAESVRLGDAAVSGKRLGAAENTDDWWSRRTKGYRHQTISTAPPARGMFV